LDNALGCKVKVPEDLHMAGNYGTAIVAQELALKI
jgi:activator of 2-hydroxyglutaryl-CoA dehydratase